MNNQNMDRSRGTKWFTFYTKVRPWLACIFSLNIIIDFFRYVEVYTSYWWTMLYFLASITQIVLGIMVFAKSRGDYINFVCFVKKVLLFETIGMAYSQGVEQYIKYEFDIGVALVSGIITLVVSYFIWYRLNLKYFNKRIVPVVNINDTSYNEPITSQEAPLENGKILYCRKCGNALLERAKFCNKCGTEVMEDTPSLAEENNKESE